MSEINRTSESWSSNQKNGPNYFYFKVPAFSFDWFVHYFTKSSLQIFPDPVEVVLGPETCLNSLDQSRSKERLPSIVVEPTEVSEVESGELRWPPQDVETEDDDEEEDLFLEQCIPPANIADWGEDEEDEEEEEETSVILIQQPGLTLIGELGMKKFVLFLDHLFCVEKLESL